MKTKSKIVMYNPKNNVKIMTNHSFQKNWEQLGFVVAKNLILFKMAG